MGIPRPEIKADVTWKTKDDPNATLPWVRATELLIIAKRRQGARLALDADQNGNTYYIVDPFVKTVNWPFLRCDAFLFL